jgi:hypothetical protein
MRDLWSYVAGIKAFCFRQIIEAKGYGHDGQEEKSTHGSSPDMFFCGDFGRS